MSRGSRTHQGTGAPRRQWHRQRDPVRRPRASPASRVTSAPIRDARASARRHVNGDHVRPERNRDLDRGEPDAPAAVHGDPFVPTYPALLNDGAVGSGVAAAETGRDGEGQLRRERHEIDVGSLERDELGKGAPVREPRLGLVVADLTVTRDALRADPAGAHERDGHPVADPPLDGRPARPPRPFRRARGPARAAGRGCPGRGPASRASRCGTARWRPPDDDSRP